MRKRPQEHYARKVAWAVLRQGTVPSPERERLEVQAEAALDVSKLIPPTDRFVEAPEAYDALHREVLEVLARMDRAAIGEDRP